MHETSMNKLWKRCNEDFSQKLNYVGYEFASHVNDEGKIIPAQNSMQASLVDWIVLATYAANNGLENRDQAFHSNLINFVKLLDNANCLKGLHFTGTIRWN